MLGVANWFGRDVLDKLTDAQVQTLLDCEHGSLHESFADCYVLTGDKKYLAWARRLCHERMLAPLADGNVDFLTRYLANTQIPKYAGFERIYALSGEDKLRAAAANFYDDVVERRSFVLGSNSAGEHFFDPADFGDAVNHPAGSESCNTVNMLRLAEALHARRADAAGLLDYYERALFNHVLSAHDPERGTSAYYTGLRPGTYRVYSDEFDSTWCYTGTGMEVPGKYGQMVYTREASGRAVEVNLFAPSRVTWRETGVTLEQRTRFPEEAGTTITVVDAPEKGANFGLKVRCPGWLDEGALTLTVNGKRSGAGSKPGRYSEIAGAWRKGDVVRLDFPMRLSVEALPNDDRHVAFLYGPIVLSAALGREPALGKLDFWQLGTTVATKAPPAGRVPTLVGDELLERIEPVEGQPLTFRTRGLAKPGDVTLVPFFRNHFQRYAVYFERMSAAEYAAEQAAAEARRREEAALDARTIDRVLIGDEASERAHGLRGERTHTGVGFIDKASDDRWRDARDGGFFAYDVKVEPGRPATLKLTFSQRDSGARTFNVLADGETLGTVSLDERTGDGVIHEQFTLPAGERGTVNVRLQAHPGNTAGGLFGLRVLRADGD